MDAQTRKSCPFPEDILGRMREMFLDYDTVMMSKFVLDEEIKLQKSIHPVIG